MRKIVCGSSDDDGSNDPNEPIQPRVRRVNNPNAFSGPVHDGSGPNRPRNVVSNITAGGNNFVHNGKILNLNLNYARESGAMISSLRLPACPPAVLIHTGCPTTRQSASLTTATTSSKLILEEFKSSKVGSILSLFQLD
ncbi:hypothetical protein T439DRAFT_76351 [Meredithblackwellia eburnea MCA 4105]